MNEFVDDEIIKKLESTKLSDNFTSSGSGVSSGYQSRGGMNDNSRDSRGTGNFRNGQGTIDWNSKNDSINSRNNNRGNQNNWSNPRNDKNDNNRNYDNGSNQYPRSDNRNYNDSRQSGYNQRCDNRLNNNYNGGSNQYPRNENRYNNNGQNSNRNDNNNRNNGNQRDGSSKWDNFNNNDRNKWDNFNRNDRNADNNQSNRRPEGNQNNFNNDEQRLQNLLPRNEKLEQELYKESCEGINFGKYDDIPVNCTGRDCPVGLEDFGSLELGPILENCINMCKYHKPTPVQKYAIPTIIARRDIMACAQTGSGKTASFLLPVVYKILNSRVQAPQRGYGRRSMPHPQALVLSPTRELAIQIFEESRKFTYRSNIRSVVIYGGASQSEQLYELSRGADIVIATPGRLIDFLNKGKVYLDKIDSLVLDEADRMLDMGFEPQIREIVELYNMPAVGVRQTMMFSATFPNEIQELASDFLNDYVFLSVGRVGSATDNVVQKLMWVEENDKLTKLFEFLSYGTKDNLMLVFVEMKRGADFLEYSLKKRKFNVIALHGDKTQQEREAALASFKSGENPVMIATAVAARGLDIKNVKTVLNYDLPGDVQEYVHRIGRTGRVGNTGTAISFFNCNNENISAGLMGILTENKQDIPPWLSECANRNQFKSGGRNPRRGGRFGGNDFRSDQRKNKMNVKLEAKRAENRWWGA